MAYSGQIPSRDAVNTDFGSVQTGVIFDEGIARLVPNLSYDSTPKVINILGFFFCLVQSIFRGSAF
ncbi:unnamed protein product [Toxocara canis]|uniref:Peptidase A1 domain-containing protein n=1 Tax=Toxocara canis TaxID=6265 RepID=A0A183U7F6_TOXCA|nr:unnamed protein product [Toxocara canis]